MTKRQHKFVQEYVKDGNASQAAVRAGYSAKGAHVQAHRLLKNDTVAEAIAKLRAPALEKAQITLEGHLAMLAQIRDEARATGQMGAANAAEANRGKVSGFYVERSEVSAPGGGPLAITITRKILRPGDTDANA